jgi:sugar/nucleoside kinase (ribokinase family)
MRAGGSPANTAAWLGSLGVATDFVGIVGVGDALRHSDLLVGVDAHLVEHPTLHTGTIVVLVSGQGRSMLTQRGANAALNSDDVTDDLLSRASVLHLTGHALLNDSGLAGFSGLIKRAAAKGVTVSVSPGSAGFIADYGVREFRAAIAGASILFPSLEEGRLLTGLSEPAAIVDDLGRDGQLVVLTLGADGVFVAGELVPATVAEIVDPTGAGDAFCAGFLADWIRTADPVASALAGTEVAARAVGVVGGRPS